MILGDRLHGLTWLCFHCVIGFPLVQVVNQRVEGRTVGFDFFKGLIPQCGGEGVLNVCTANCNTRSGRNKGRQGTVNMGSSV